MSKSRWIESEGGRKARTEKKVRVMPKEGSQNRTLLRALISRPTRGLTLQQIVRLGIAVHSARLSALRDMGWKIKNRHRYVKNERTGKTVCESVYFLYEA